MVWEFGVCQYLKLPKIKLANIWLYGFKPLPFPQRKEFKNVFLSSIPKCVHGNRCHLRIVS